MNIWLVILWKRYLRLDGGIILIESLILMEEFVLIMLSSFGVLGTFLVYFANPFFEGLLLKINTNTLNIISLILLIIFTIDFIISMYASFKLKNSLSKIDKDSTEEIKEKN